ncbi:MAG: glycoside hydrolase family 15 protein [Acidimicrobiia bacterium]
MTGDTFPAIGDYAFISDCRSLALIGRDASVEWACFGRFDTAPAFARILDREIGGWFRIGPEKPARTSHRYLPDTNVLETRFETDTGAVTVTDCLPVGTVKSGLPDDLLVRVVHGVEGSVDVRLQFRPRFEYGLTTPFVELVAGDLVRASGSAHALLLQSEIAPLECDDHGGADATGTVRAGETLVVALMSDAPHRLEVERLGRDELRAAVDGTIGYWREWSNETVYDGPYADAVRRSALVLKGLTAAETGAVIAAATTSLPEEIGGERNWDYRYCWVRDSAALLVGLAQLGHFDEARAFGQWLLRTTAGRADEIQIMYGIGGERLLNESVLTHLTGYRGSQPVRVGNGAWDQLQIDTFGELIASAWFVAEVLGASTQPGAVRRLDDHLTAFARELVETMIARFDEPDEGIWEVRGGRQHFLFSKLMSWLGVEAAIRLTEKYKPDRHELLAHWRQASDAMRARIETDGVDPTTGAFTQAFGSTVLDATALQVGLRHFLPFDDPRVVATIEAIDRDLTRNGHVFRYRAADGLAGGEGTFVFCTLWLVSALARSGQVERAEERFEMVLSCASDLGLLAEEIDADTGEMLGNYPQAFSHVGLIAAATAIGEARAAS